MLSDDLACIFADTGLTVSVEIGAQSVRGFLSSRDVAEPDGQGGIIVVPRRTVIVKDGALTGLVSDLALTVDGQAYRLHGQPRSDGRGKVSLMLAEDHA